MIKRTGLSLSVAVLLAGLAAAQEAQPAKEDEFPNKAEMAEAARIAATMPKSVSGVVFLDKNDNGAIDDGEGMVGVRVTDGVDFVTTGEGGRYTIEIKPDPMIRYTPARVINVSWPEGVWPVRREPNGRWSWWIRLMDVKDPEDVNFRFTERMLEKPICVAFGTDPHSNLERESDLIFSDEVAGAGDHVAFGVMGCDLGYYMITNAEAGYTSVEKYTNNFPVMLINVLGNHDISACDETRKMHELADQGAFTKHLGPVHWSFDAAGVHFVAMNWPLVDDTAQAWLRKDLASVAKDRPVYLFIHAWDAWLGPICAENDNIKLVLAGHSHRNIFAGMENNAEFWTKMSLYTLLYVNGDEFTFVDRCTYVGGRAGWGDVWSHHGRACALVHEWPYADPNYNGGEHSEASDVTLDGAREIAPVNAATYDIRWGAKPTGEKPAARFGLRLTAADGTVQEFVYDNEKHTVNLMGLETYFNPALPHVNAYGRPDNRKPEEQEWVEMRILVQPDKVRVLVNNRLHYQKLITPGKAKKIEFFTEGGEANFGRVDVWQHEYPADYKPSRQANTG